jgi:hypothetical protein
MRVLKILGIVFGILFLVTASHWLSAGRRPR